MKTKIIVLIILLSGCKQPVQEVKSYATTSSTIVSTPPDKTFSNPALIYGTSFLQYVSLLKQTENSDTLIYFTSKSSLKKHKLSEILELYRNTNFSFSKKLVSMKCKNGIYTLNYLAHVYATKRLITIEVAVEQDTCRLVLPAKLSEFLR